MAVAVKLPRWSMPAWTVAASTLVFVATFSYLSMSRLWHFGTPTFDIGIYDQAFWLVSRGKAPFITLRGMNVWAHHINLIAYLYAPFYWLGAGARFLLVTQVMVLGLGAIPVYRMCLRRDIPKRLGAVAAIAYLLYSPMQWLTWHTYHPETLAITPILFAAWFIEERRWGALVIVSLLAVSTREEAGIALGLLCIRYALSNARQLLRRRPIDESLGSQTQSNRIRSLLSQCDVVIPLIGGLACFVWFIVCTKLIIPHFNNSEAPYYIQRFYGPWGRTVGEVLKNALSNPFEVARSFFDGQNTTYVALMLLCLGGLSILSPSWLLLSLPTFFWNAISIRENTRDIHYHYTVFVIPFVIIASLNGLRRAHHSQSGIRKKIGLAMASVAIVSTQLATSPSPLAIRPNPWVGANTPEEISAGLRLIKPDDRVSTDGFYGATITHRASIYNFPNPFVPSQYGSNEVTETDPNSVDRILVWGGYETANPRFYAVLNFLIKNKYYRVELQNTRVLVGKQIRAIPDSAIKQLRRDYPPPIDAP